MENKQNALEKYLHILHPSIAAIGERYRTATKVGSHYRLSSPLIRLSVYIIEKWHEDSTEVFEISTMSNVHRNIIIKN